MSVYISERIVKPPYFRLAPLSKGRGKRLPYVIGFDSEAENSYPYTLQFSLPDTDETDTYIVYIPRRKHAALIAFMEFVHRVCSSRKREYLIYGFNLAYEFTQLFHDFHDDAKDADDFWLEYVTDDGTLYRIDVFKAKRYFMTIVNQSTRVRIRFLDAMAFYTTSLDKAATMLGIVGKLDKPPEFRRRDWQTPEFQAYAKRDAYITRRLGETIIEMHARYDVATCISAPHFASSTFRRRFMRSEIATITAHLEQYGLTSYHGGKNGYYLDGPADLNGIYAYDIRSAYPEAMRSLPDIERATWRETVGYVPDVPSLWHATIIYDPCIFRGLQHADGSWMDSRGRYTVIATGYELDAMLERGECEIVRAVGYIMDGPGGGPLADYVDTFYHLKQTTKDETTRITAKLFLNSLYGKFFQKVPIGLAGSYEWTTGNYVAGVADQTGDFEAGGLYHPPIASLITGYVRAKIHRLEHRYSAIMTSTDGIFARESPRDGDIGDKLGDLDVSIGRLRIWRERLYLYDYDHGGKRKTKAALHGFRGNADALAAIPLATGRYTYTAQQMVTLGMSTRSYNGERHPPGSFVMLPFGLDV